MKLSKSQFDAWTRFKLGEGELGLIYKPIVDELFSAKARLLHLGSSKVRLNEKG
jgi:hypothetical protein